MLKYLHIENIAVIEETDIEFGPGFNVLTGETGAGKSIVIDAINAVLGERTSKDLIRTGCDNATVSVVFDNIDDQTLLVLDENGISPEDGEIIITRKLSATSKGFIKVNNIPVTASVLREIAKNLINIHGQHDNQALLNPEMHMGFIDSVAENSALLDDYYAVFKQLNKIRKELQSLQMDEDEKQRKIDILKYQINELESANINIGEYDDLKRKLSIANSFEKTFKAMLGADYILGGSDDSDGALTQLENVLKLLKSIDGNEFTGSYNKISEAVSLIQDARSDISGFVSNTENQNLNPDEINQRLDFLSRLMVKYGSSEKDMLDYLSNAKAELENIALSQNRINELSVLLEEAKEKLIDKAEKLTKSRQKAANSFSAQVCEILKYLNMPNVRFVTQLQQGKYTKTGCDTAEFLISANDGENVKPLHKIASGGELSRVMLSIKSVLLDKDKVGTMIFDEIDTGISGYAAGKVGTQLKKVANSRQVICVTHLAQIAAMCDTHLLIEKLVKDGHTFTSVVPLDYDGRISEIARIMSGSELTENLYNSAKELIDRSK